LYTYIAQGLGPTVGVLSGWALVPGYLFVAMPIVIGFSNYANLVLSAFGFHISPILLYAFCTGIAWFYAYTDIQLSSVLMMLFELIAVGFVAILSAIVLVKHGFRIDTSQLFLQGVSFQGVRLGLVFAIFCFTGFESAAALGEEAKHPLRFIPNAMIWSIVLSGLFYIVVSYAEVFSFSYSKIPLDKSTFPINDMAEIAGAPWLGIILSVGILFSCLTCLIACLNAGARIFFAMARHGIFPSPIGRAHVNNETPYIAVNFVALTVFLVPTIMTLAGIKSSDIYGFLGSIGSYSFMLVYILVCIAAPVYLHRLKKLRRDDLLISALGVVFMLIPVVSSVYPLPPAPYNIFPILFLLFLGVGSGWFFVLRNSSPSLVEDMQRDLENISQRFSSSKVG
jgi:amino acid transporter